MDTQLAIGSESTIVKELTEYDNAMLSAFSFLGLPTEQVLVSVSERKKVFRDVSDVLELIPKNILPNSIYISKFLSAVSAGLFDAALNYLWDETISQLRDRIAQYDIQYFFDIVFSGEKRSKYSDKSDLCKVDDSDLIQGAKEIGIITDIGYRLLNDIKYMRNWASAAHPNQVELTGLQLISWLETCIKEVISLPQSNITIEIRKLLKNIKSNVISDVEAETISDFFCTLDREKAESLCNGFFGIYCRNDTNLDTRRNIKLLLPKLWEIVSEDFKWEIGIKFGKHKINNNQAEAELARNFLQIVDAESYLPESIRSTELRIALEELNKAHYAFCNNFYLEPSCARQVSNLVGENEIPSSVNRFYVLVITNVFLTNGNGAVWDAEDIYKDLIKKFTQFQMFIAISSFTTDQISSKLQSKLCEAKYLSLLDIAKNTVTAPLLLDFIEVLRNYEENYSELRNDEIIMQQVKKLSALFK